MENRTNCYEKAIGELKVYDNIFSQRIRNLVERVKINLEEGKQNFEMEQRLSNYHEKYQFSSVRDLL